MLDPYVSKFSKISKISSVDRALCSPAGTTLPIGYSHIAKFDLTAPSRNGFDQIQKVEYPPRHGGGEVIFVPRDPDLSREASVASGGQGASSASRSAPEEDDGFVMGFVTDASNMMYHPERMVSYCMVRDAK
jgi:hypothetical protein